MILSKNYINVNKKHKVSTPNQVLVIIKLKMLTGINRGTKERTKEN